MAAIQSFLIDYLLPLCGGAFLVVGLVIYRANALRAANRYFALQMLVAGLWTINYSFSVQPGANAVTHLRIGSAIASVLPWILACVRDVLTLGNRPGRLKVRTHATWGTFSLLLALCTPWHLFLFRDEVSLHPSYGALWIGYHVVLCLAMAWIAWSSLGRLRELEVRARDEMITAVIAAAGTIAMVSAFLVFMIGEPRLPPPEYALIVIIYAFILAWIIVVRGIYDARSAASLLARTTGLVLAVATVFLVVTEAFERLTPIGGALADIVASTVAALLGMAITRSSLRRQNALLYRSIAGFQGKVNDLAREAISADLAIALLEKIVAEHTGTTRAYILSEVQPGLYQRGHVFLRRDALRWQRSERTTWVARSSIDLDAISREPDSTLNWIVTDEVSLLMVSPESPQHVNIVVALGPRRDHQSYTFFELECLGMMVESCATALTTLAASTQAQHAGQMMAIGLISASVIHEVKQPLAALRLFFKMLPTRYHDESFRREYFTVIPRELAHIEETLSQLLRLGRTEEYHVTAFNPLPLVEDTLTLIQPKAQSSFVEVAPALQAASARVQGDPVVFKQALLNLCLNALEAMSRQGDENRHLHVVGREDGAFYEITVRDTGPGIPQVILNKLFRPFVTTKEDGIGLGLYITRDQVVKTGGMLSAHNHEDGGAVFQLRFPLEGSGAALPTLPVPSAER